MGNQTFYTAHRSIKVNDVWQEGPFLTDLNVHDIISVQSVKYRTLQGELKTGWLIEYKTSNMLAPGSLLFDSTGLDTAETVKDVIESTVDDANKVLKVYPNLLYINFFRKVENKPSVIINTDKLHRLDYDPQQGVTHAYVDYGGLTYDVYTFEGDLTVSGQYYYYY